MASEGDRGATRARSDRFHRAPDPLQATDPTRPVAPATRPVDPTRPGGPAGSNHSGRGDWRSTVMAASGINVLAGIWLIIAPFVLGYNDGDPHWNDIVFGAIVAVLALARVAGAYRASWMSWLNMLIGAWIFISAFWLDNTSTAETNDIILGAIVFVLGLISASASDAAAPRAAPPARW